MATDLISGQISFAGLGSGTDFNQLIDGLMKVERRRIVSLESWRKSWEDKVKEFQDLNTKMITLRSTLQKMDSVNKFVVKNASSSHSSIVDATAEGKALPGKYQIEVGAIAKNDIFITSGGAADLNTSITSAKTDFTFSIAGTSYTLSNIGAGTTMQGFINAINNHEDIGKVVKASQIYDGNKYHLLITGRDFGADNQLIISNTGSLIFSASSFQETQNAQNSKIRVNGFPTGSGAWMERSDPVITDAIPNLRLNLKSAQPGTVVDIEVSTDKEKIKENIKKFVDEVNTIRKKILEITEVSSSGVVDKNEDGTPKSKWEKKHHGKISTGAGRVKGSILTGNYGLQILSHKINEITASSGLGFGSEDVFNNLANAGIYTDTDKGSPTYGLLAIRETTEDPDKKFMTLDYALEHNVDAIGHIFADNLRGLSRSSDFSYISSIEGLSQAGVHEVSVTTDATGITSATINGEPADIGSDGITITGRWKTKAAGVQVRLSNFQPNTTTTGEIALKNGKIKEFVDELKTITKEYKETKDETFLDGGILPVLIHNYDDIMESIDKKILYEEDRLRKLEYNYKMRFSRLDTTLGKYTAIQNQLRSQIAKLQQS